MLWWLNCKEKGEFKFCEGFLIVVLFWIVLGSVGALFFIFLESLNFMIIDAFFEFFFGLIIMGAIMLVGLDLLFYAIFFYC